MQVDWLHFTPWQSLFGGVLLGISATMMILLNGRILGISGILGGLIFSKPGDRIWRIVFLLGVLITPLIIFLIIPHQDFTAPKISANMMTIAIAGLLVGFGTRYGSGCTSGHGICGLSRFSRRSIVATITFMFFGFVTVYLSHHLLGIT
jgi:uncharacterized protein